jgi:hypothetical protein
MTRIHLPRGEGAGGGENMGEMGRSNVKQALARAFK